MANPVEAKPNTDYPLFPKRFKPSFSGIQMAEVEDYGYREIFRYNTRFMGAEVSFLLETTPIDGDYIHGSPAEEPLGDTRVSFKPYADVIEELPLVISIRTEATLSQYYALQKWSIRLKVGAKVYYYRVTGDLDEADLSEVEQDYEDNPNEPVELEDLTPKSLRGHLKQFVIPSSTDRWDEIKYRFVQRFIPSCTGVPSLMHPK